MQRFFLLIIISLLPTIALAAAPTYDLISPIGGMSTGVDMKTYLANMIIVTIGVAGVLAVIMIVICGIKMMTSGAVSGKSEAKECIWNAIFGLLIAIASWAFLFTINPDLLKDDVALVNVPVPAVVVPAPPASVEPMPTIPGWYFRFIKGGSTINSQRFDTSEACNQVKTVANNSGVTIVPVTASGGSVECFEIAKGAPPAPPNTAPPVGSGSETATRNSLCGNNSCVGSTPLGINRNACVGTNIATGYHCTNVDGLPGGTVGFLAGLPGACGCNVIITGGTENGHASHGQSIPVFDLAKTPALVTFIKANASIKNNPSFCSAGGGSCHSKWLYGGYWFTDEDAAHFHVCKDGTTAPPGKSVNLFKKACTQI